MKNFALVLSSLIFASSSFAASTKIVTTTSFEGFTNVSESFSPDAEVESSICYAGNAKKVCSLAKKQAKASVKAYEEGDHSFTEVKSCTLNKGVVTIAYVAGNDYVENDKEGTAILLPCSIAE